MRSPSELLLLLLSSVCVEGYTVPGPLLPRGTAHITAANPGVTARTQYLLMQKASEPDEEPEPIEISAEDAPSDVDEAGAEGSTAGSATLKDSIRYPHARVLFSRKPSLTIHTPVRTQGRGRRWPDGRRLPEPGGDR